MCMINPSDPNDQPVLKQIRDSLGLSRERFARLIGCSTQKIYRGENGVEITFTIEEIQNLNIVLRDNFGCDVDSLPKRLSEPGDLTNLMSNDS